MSDVETAYHRRWLGMAEPVEGLVVSVPVLVEAACMQRLGPELSQRLADDEAPEGERLTVPIGKLPDGRARRRYTNLARFLEAVLELSPDLFDGGERPLSKDLELFVPEGRETIRATLALKKRGVAAEEAAREPSEELTPAAKAGRPYVMLVQEVPDVALDQPVAREGAWAYPPIAKFERLLRACRVPIGLITNGEELRLVYAPHGESTGVLTFRVADLAAVGGRDLLDAFVMLLSRRRFFGVAAEHQLPAILAESRRRQADVTTQLAHQVQEALAILLRGFQAAAERDGARLLEEPLTREGGDFVYKGLLTVLLRLVFLLYAEDRGLLPTKDAPYGEHLSLLALFGQLQSDHAAFPDTMARRFGAWPRLVALFRAVYAGAKWRTDDGRDVTMPPRRGELFDPARFPFLEGWGPEGGAPEELRDRMRVRVPTIDDGTVFAVLERLLMLKGQRLSYRALDVEQIGSVYEGLMGFSVQRLASPGVCVRPDHVWITVADVREQPSARRAAWLEETAGLAKAAAQKVAAEIGKAKTDDAVLAALDAHRAKGTDRAAAGTYVLQPGAERRRTSAHYTPPSLTGPIVRKTLEPLLRAMGGAPSSKDLLDLKICDPAMGSGAFLVEACRFLADQVVLAWTREGELAKIGSAKEDVTLYARRLVAQRCLYGLDLNPFAVTLARLSMWLVTLAKDEPFTFVDHALRCGDALVGLSIEQVRAFHWKPSAQIELGNVRAEVDAALEEARVARQKILDLAGEGASAVREKEKLLRDANLAIERVRIIADLVVGAFFAHEKDKDRERERASRLEKVRAWLDADTELPDDLRTLRDACLAQVRPFHWMVEFPEIFHAGRKELLGASSEPPYLDAFVGNPPFMGGIQISGRFGPSYRDWVLALHEGAHGNADYCAHFFRRVFLLLGTSGTIGFVATNTIAQGDTRTTGLAHMLASGARIYDATTSAVWSDLAKGGDANVAVSIVHLSKGSVTPHVHSSHLDGRLVATISSLLSAGHERPDPIRLQANARSSFKGTMVYGMGFVLAPDERDALVRRNKRNAERILPYLGGEEVNTSPTQDFNRYVISFGTMSLEEAERWPDLLDIVREKVKPERDKNNRECRRKYWWRFGEAAPALYEAIAPLRRCLVNSQVSKHLVFAFQPTDRVFAHTLCAYAFDDDAHFAVLQSRIHEPWARLLSSSTRNDLRYAPSDCFETFPFPHDAALTPTGAVKRTGKALYEARAAFMVKHQIGLTQAYNRLKDPACGDAEVVHLRRLHEDMDRAVLAAYGWTDIAVPAYGTPTTVAEKKALEAFEDEVLDRLFALNAERAEEEKRGLSPRAVPAESGVLPIAEGRFPPLEEPEVAGRNRRSSGRLSVKKAGVARQQLKAAGGKRGGR